MSVTVCAPPVNAVNYCSGSDTQNMKADRNENVRCAFRDCRNKSCFALLSIRKEITHGIPVDTFRLQADRSWKIAVVSVHSAKQQITGLLCQAVQRLTDSGQLRRKQHGQFKIIKGDNRQVFRDPDAKAVDRFINTEA